MKHKTNKTEETQEAVAVAATIDPTLKDAMIALLIVSLTVNTFFLIAWVALKVTNIYDTEVAAFLFSR